MQFGQDIKGPSLRCIIVSQEVHKSPLKDNICGATVCLFYGPRFPVKLQPHEIGIDFLSLLIRRFGGGGGALGYP